MSRVESPAFGVYAGASSNQRSARSTSTSPPFEHGRRSDRGSEQDSMDAPQMTPSQARAAAVAELFAALDDLLAVYRAVPDGQREDRWAADADVITGEIARRLAVARANLSRSSPHPAT